MVTSAREAALKALASYRKNGAWSDAALNTVLRRADIDEREAALASRIFYGVIQNRTLCDFYISSFLSLKLSSLQPMVHDILLLSVYQLIFMSKIPVSAAVNEGVSLAKKHSNPRAAGLVNAVLRKISINLDKLPEVGGNDIFERLSVLYSHPVWLVKAFCGRLGEEGAEALLKVDNSDAVISVNVNTLKADMQSVLSRLNEELADAVVHPWLHNCLEIRHAHHLERLRAFNDGQIYVQDAAALLAVRAAGPKPGMLVIDGCSAPGGKSFASAIEMMDTGRILSCDINEKKLCRVLSGAQRMGIKIIETRQMDARTAEPALFDKADIVLADVPCSGFGVIRKKPEIRFKPESEIEKLPELQLEIINALSKYVKPGGILLYSTCTLLQRENEDIIAAFLKTHQNFYPETFQLPEPIGEVKAGMLTLWPHLHGTDGFFICRLRRRQ